MEEAVVEQEDLEKVETPQCNSWSVSPLNAPAGLPVSAQAYPITIGGGGGGGTTGPNSPGSAGSTSNLFQQ